MRASEFLSEHLNGVAGVVVRARHVDAGEPRWFDQSVRDALIPVGGGDDDDARR
jgi:hypothetical protein